MIHFFGNLVLPARVRAWVTLSLVLPSGFNFGHYVPPGSTVKPTPWAKGR
jgi:hypothetical protein